MMRKFVIIVPADRVVDTGDGKIISVPAGQIQHEFIADIPDGTENIRVNVSYDWME